MRYEVILSSTPMNYSSFSFKMVKVRILHFLFFLTIWSFVESANEDYMKNSIINYFSDTRHHDPLYSEYKARAKEYIYNQFQSFGLTTEYHTFVDLAVSKTATFQTVIGTLKGTRFGTSADNILGVGAHYDTVNSAKDNSGSRQFLNTWVQQWVQNNYGSSSPGVYGVIIMDTLMEYNISAYSQNFPSESLSLLNQSFPGAMAHIYSDDFRGDFLTLVYRAPTYDALLAGFFRAFWDADNRTRFQIESFPLQSIQNTWFSDFYRSDHKNFWESGITAIFLTDSADFRGDMIDCYHAACDNLDIMLTDDNLQFLGKTADIVTRTIHHLSGPSYDKSQANGSISGYLPLSSLLGYLYFSIIMKY